MGPVTQFDQSTRELRQARNLSQRELAGWVGVTFTYIRKIKNDKIEFGDYPSEALISKLAAHPTAVGSSSFPGEACPVPVTLLATIATCFFGNGNLNR